MSICFVARGQTARFARTGILVVSDGSHRISIPKVSEPLAEVPTAPCVHAILKRHGDYFIVVTTSEWSRGYANGHIFIHNGGELLCVSLEAAPAR